MATLAVTGATGRVGGRVAGRLAESGLRVRLIVRDPARAPRLRRSEVAVASYGDTNTSRTALNGVETLFMVSAGESPDRVAEHRRFIDAAVAAGVAHLVYLSFHRASPDATFTLARDHWATEEHIRASGLAWTFVRDNLYLDFLPLMADDEGVIRGPAGDGRVAAVAIDDVADVAAAILTEPASHQSTAYELTGPQALTLGEAADALTRALGRHFTYTRETVEQAYASRARHGAPDWQLDAWVSTYTAIAAGELAGMTRDVARITGRAPRSIHDVFAASSG